MILTIGRADFPRTVLFPAEDRVADLYCNLKTIMAAVVNMRSVINYIIGDLRRVM